MATSQSQVCEDELTCALCKKIFQEPITLGCGHSFCLICVEEYRERWEGKTICTCPTCHAVFPQTLQFKRSVSLASVVAQVKLGRGEGELEIEAQEARRVQMQLDLMGEGRKVSGDSEIRCELCQAQAFKLCVPCEILCCEKHVKPHQQKWHRLVEPGVKVEELRCSEHGQFIQLYCKNDNSLICLMCMVGDHQDHKIIPAAIAYTELKERLAAEAPHLEELMQCIGSRLLQVQREVEDTRRTGGETKNMLERKRRELYRVVDETVDLMKKRVSDKEGMELYHLNQQVHKLQKEMNVLREAESALQAALQDLEAVTFLKHYEDFQHRLQSVSHFPVTNITQTTVLDFSMEEKKLDSLIEINKNFLKEIQVLQISKGGSMKQLGVTDLDLSSLKRLYGQTLSLDPNSAYPGIEISSDLKMATRTDSEQSYPEHPQRFDCYAQVLTNESFSSGRHYWELDVSQARRCRIGIAYDFMARKGRGRECQLGGNPESWCIWISNNDYTAWHDGGMTELNVQDVPTRLGLCLDHEAGELACYVDSQLLHTFWANFTGPVKPALGIYYYNGDSVQLCSL